MPDASGNNTVLVEEEKFILWEHYQNNELHTPVRVIGGRIIT